MRQVKDLLDRRNSGDQALQDVCFHVMPMIDPDGAAISQYGVDGMKTQKMKNTVIPTPAPTARTITTARMMQSSMRMPS